MLRPWYTPDARVLRLVVADEDEKEDAPTEGSQEDAPLKTADVHVIMNTHP
jgi:hypothetical protein